MATIKTDSEEVQIPDNNSITDACRQLGIPFSCEDGSCGTCLITVLKGEENLSPLNEKEKELGIEPPQRLACQCKVKNGEIFIKGYGF